MSKFRQLINPHCHSDASIDGAATITQIVKKNIELGATAVAITEHGNINSAMEHYVTCKKLGVRPILGVELYIEDPFKEELWKSRFTQELLSKGTAPDKLDNKLLKKLKDAYVHLTVHFKDDIAYKYFCNLSPIMEQRAVVKYGERKPIITLDELKAISGHITIGSGCLIGYVQKFILPWQDTNRPDLAERAYCTIRDIAGPGNFFVELFPHKVNHNWEKPKKDDDNNIIEAGRFIPIGCNTIAPDGDIQRAGNLFVMEMAKKYGDPIVISLDSHFASRGQKVIQDAKLGNGQENWRFHNSYHVMSTDEVVDELKHTLNATDRDIEEWVENSYQFAERFKDFKLQTNSDRWVLNPLEEGSTQKLKQMIDRHGRMNWRDTSMVERLKYEIQVLANNGKINLLSYFFTVEDIANFCRENDILINVRGSAGGSLLLYLIGVSAVNPLKHNLSFERFLTLGRIKANTLPDVDMDISTVGRDKVIDYLEQKYGDRICRLSTDAMLKLKSSIRDAERALLGRVRETTEKLCKSLPNEGQGSNSRDYTLGYTDAMGVHHDGVLDTNAGLKKFATENKQIWDMVVAMLGIQRQKSVHACGVIITDRPVQEYCPVITVSKTKATGFSPKSAELAGLVKYDLLGLNTLRDIEGAVRSIRTRLGAHIDQWNLPYDKKSFDEFGLGYTETVFQFDTETVRPYLIDTQPKSIDDLAAITALCRPGTLDALSEDGRTLAQLYVARRKGEPITYIHPELEPILKETEGIQLYQEQTLQIFRDLANMTYEDAEVVRRGIGKKDEKLLASSTGRLKEECLKRGWTEAQVKILIDQIMASAKYSFNKSHAISYAYVAYACMYLKTNYRLDWWKSCLSNADKDELSVKFWRFVSPFTDLPDINSGSQEYTIKNDRLIAPISVINGIGEKAYAQLTGKAPYANLREFVVKHFGKEDKSTAVHSGIARKLIASGIMDNLFDNPGDIIENKLYTFEKLKAEIKGTAKVEPVPDEYCGTSALGKYLIKKDLISVYSEDLKPLMLPHRHFTFNGTHWIDSKGHPVLGGVELEYHKHRYAQGVVDHGSHQYNFVGYVVSERTFTYKDKTKQATELLVDVDGKFFKEVLWPGWDDSEAPCGFEGLPVFLLYMSDYKRFQLRNVVKLLEKTDKAKYNVL